LGVSLPRLLRACWAAVCSNLYASMNCRFLFRHLASAVVVHGANAQPQVKINSGGAFTAAFPEGSSLTVGAEFAGVVPIVGLVQAPEVVNQTVYCGAFDGVLRRMIAGLPRAIYIPAIGSVALPGSLQRQFGAAKALVDLVGISIDFRQVAAVRGDGPAIAGS